MVHPPGIHPQRYYAFYSFFIKIVLHTLHHSLILVMADQHVTPSSTTCDLTLNYTLKLTPSELCSSQQNTKLRLKLKNMLKLLHSCKSDNELLHQRHLKLPHTSSIYTTKWVKTLTL
jgi:hypothetical protein